MSKYFIVIEIFGSLPKCKHAFHRAFLHCVPEVPQWRGEVITTCEGTFVVNSSFKHFLSPKTLAWNDTNISLNFWFLWITKRYHFHKKNIFLLLSTYSSATKMFDIAHHLESNHIILIRHRDVLRHHALVIVSPFTTKYYKWIYLKDQEQAIPWSKELWREKVFKCTQ